MKASIRWAALLLSDVLGGYGVFCAVCSFTSPEIGAKAIMSLGGAFALSYFGER